MYLCVIVSVGTSFTVAVFDICALFSKSFTVTLNDNSATSCADNSTFIPLANSSAVYLVVLSFNTIESVTNVVPSGTLSFTFTVVGAVPVLLSKVIVYVIVSFCFTSTSLVGFDVLLGITFGLFTVFVTVFVSVEFTLAVFSIVFSNIPFAKVFTVTLKLKVVLPCAGTSTAIPLFKSSAVYAVSPLFTLTEFSTNVVPSGIESFIVAFPAK